MRYMDERHIGVLQYYENQETSAQPTDDVISGLDVLCGSDVA